MNPDTRPPIPHRDPDALSSWDAETIDPRRTYLVVATSEPEAAAQAVRAAPVRPDVCVTSPSAEAHATAALAAAGHYMWMFDEPLLARRGDGESTADLAGRYAHALRVLHALDSRRTLVVVDDFPLDGRPTLELDDAGLLRYAQRIEQALPLP
jgi:hypothetical protein